VRTVAARTNLNAILYQSAQQLTTERALIAAFFVLFDIRNSWPEKKVGCQCLPDDVQDYAAG